MFDALARRGRAGATVIVLAALAAVVVVGGGSAATTSKPYVATIAPTTGVAGTAADYVYSIRNESASGVDNAQALGSADITVPPGWSVNGALTAVAKTATGGATTKVWTAAVSAGKINVRSASSSDRLAGGEVVEVSFNATAPSGGCTATAYAWQPVVKQSNNFNGSGNDFYLDGAAPTVTVASAVGPLASFVLGAVGNQVAGASFQVTATAKDSCGRTITGYTGGATVSGNLGTSPSGASPTYGALSFSGGVGTGSVTAYKAESGRTVTVSAGAVSATSNSFAVAPGPLASVSWGVQPSTTVVGSSIDPAPAVDVEDAYGNGRTDSVTVAIGTNPGGGTLGGTKTRAAVGGTATFTGLTIDKYGFGYTLVATAGASSATSAPFDILPPDSKRCTNDGSENGTDADTCITNIPGIAGATMKNPSGDEQWTGETLYVTTIGSVSGTCLATTLAGSTSVEVGVVGGNPTVTRPLFTIALILKKQVLQSNGLTSRAADTFDVCLGAKRLDGGSGGWITKSGAEAVYNSADGYYYGLVPDCSALAGLGAPADNPCVKVKTKNENEFAAAAGQSATTLGFKSSDMGVVLQKPYPWDGKAGWP